ncbi:MAG: DnaJ domain-containing protein [Candidatus Xenobiia bacterium LiM19]
MNDYYKILGVDPSAEAEVITSAYKALVRKYHPDTYKGPDAEDRMKEINEAYEVLNNHLKRTDYDRSRKGAGSWPIGNIAAF